VSNGPPPAPSITPLFDRIIIRRDSPATQSAAGIVIPESSRERPTTGIVLAVGEGYLQPSGTIVPLRTRVGDRVMFGEYAGQEISLPLPGESKDVLTVMREEEVFGILSETTTPSSAPVPAVAGR
jgi:chaperonin GroES